MNIFCQPVYYTARIYIETSNALGVLYKPPIITAEIKHEFHLTLMTNT